MNVGLQWSLRSNLYWRRFGASRTAPLHTAVGMSAPWWLMSTVLWCTAASFYTPLMSRAPRARWAFLYSSTQRSDLAANKSDSRSVPVSWGCSTSATPWPSSWSRREAWPPRAPGMFWTSSPPPFTSGFLLSWGRRMMWRNISPSLKSTTNEVVTWSRRPSIE